MKNSRLIFLFLFFALLFLACDNVSVPQADYDALEAYTKELEAENDSLRFENSDLKLYNDYLEAELDSIQNNQRQLTVHSRQFPL